MPVRSLNSSVLKWPSDKDVLAALINWVEAVSKSRNDIVRIGYFGSYAKGNWGVGSDLDLIIVLHSSTLPFARRAAEWDLSGIPVPVDLFVYTVDEFESLRQSSTRFGREVLNGVVWIYAVENSEDRR